ncbi:response regulator [Phormidesmis priestleyi]
MFTPSSVRSIEPAIAAYKVNSTRDLADHFQICSRKGLSGRLDVSVHSSSEPIWSFFFHLGQLIWGVGELHPFRRWNRQLSQYCPDLAVSSMQQNTAHPHNWNYKALVSLIKQGQLQQSNLSAIVIGNILELLFDVIQAVQQLRPSSEMHLTYGSSLPNFINSALFVPIEADRAWRRAEQAWSIWQQSGLAHFSPNSAPVIWDDGALRQQTSLLAYHNLTTLASGCWTLRDIAVQLKQPLAPLTRSLLPYINQGVIGLNPVSDLRFDERPVKPPLVAYIEDSRFDSAAMGHILAQAGYRFVSIHDAVQAVPMLLEHKPDLIFLDLLMPIANGYEVCAQIRRITAFKDTPIVILTSSDGIVDRVRAKLAGALGFLAKPIEPNKVIDALQQYLPDFAPMNKRDTG